MNIATVKPFEIEYIVELSSRSFLTALALNAERISDAMLFILEDESDSTVSMLAIRDVSNDDSIVPLIDYDNLL